MRKETQTLSTSRILRTLIATGALAALSTPALAVDSTWDGGGVGDSWFTADNWDNNTVPNGLGDTAVINDISPVTTNLSVTLDEFTVLFGGDLSIGISLNFNVTGFGAASTVNNAGTINLGNNSDFGIDGSVNNSGTINIASTGNQTDLELSGDTMLTGGGEIVFSGAFAGINDAIGTQTLSISDQTLRGVGQLGRNSIDFINESSGLINADDAGGGVLLLDAQNTVANSGTLRASNGGELQISSSGIDNSGGVIEALSGSTVSFLGSVNVTGGTVRSVGSGVMQTGISSNITFFDTDFEGTITAGNNSDFGVGGTINNTGTINLASTGNATDLELQVGGATLTGGGEVVLSGAFAGINDIAGTQLLTIADQTIRGNGNIGQNSINIVNSASSLINADSTGNTLIIDPNGTVDNDGTMRASNGGILQLNAGVYNNDGGVIEALDGSTVNFTGGTVNEGTVRGIDTGVVLTTISSNVTFFDTTFEGSLISGNNSDFGIGGIINNSGTLNIASTGNQTDLEIQVGGATLVGGGEVVFSGAFAGINDATGTQTLIIADQTLRGVGQLGRNTIDIVNQSGNLIDADDAGGGSLVIDPAVTFTNAGTLRASNGGELQLNAGDFQNAGGVIEALDGSTLTVNSGASITGGTVRSVGTGEVQTPISSNVNFFGTTLEGSFTAGNNSDFGIGGTINNTGTLNIVSTGNQTDLEIQIGGATLTGGGEVVLSGAFAGINGATGTQTLTITNQTIRGVGNIGRNSMDFVNQAGGLVDADVDGGLLIIDPLNTFNNEGTVRASNGGTLRLDPGTFDNTGTLDARQGGVMTNNGAAINQLVEDGTIGDQITGGTYQAFDGTLNVALANFDARFNSATLNFFGDDAQTNLFDESASSAGNIVSNAFSFNDGIVIVQGGANLTTNVNEFNNAGSVTIIGTSVFAVVDGGNGDFINGSPTTLSGSGTLQADLINTSDGVVSPGVNDTPATLTIDGDALFGDSGSLNINIAGTGNNDLLAVLGTLSLDGTLDIDLDPGFSPLLGEQFLIATATSGSITGDFASITDNSAVYDFVSVIDAPNGQVFVQAVPEPSSLALLGLAGLGLLRRRRA